MNWKMTFNGIKLNYILLLILFGFSEGLLACKSLPISIPFNQDTLPTAKIYTGYRLQITNIKLESRKKNRRKITCTLINTGREKIRLPYKNADAPTILFDYDNSLITNKLAAYTNSLEKALLRKKFSLDAGKIASNFGLKFNISEKELADKKSKKTKKLTSSSSTPMKPIYDKDNCADLRIDTFFILKRHKKWVELGFKITNYGNGPAGLYGATKDTEDNVAVRAYVSGTPKLSRGDMILGGSFIEGGLEDKNGVLMPNESFSGSFRVETRKKTRYMPYFILSVDDYQSLWECDERNNVRALLDR